MLRHLLASASLLSLLTLAGCDECAEIDCACPQGTIVVTVVDATTKEALFDATVAIGNDACAEHSSEHYCFVPAGTYSVQVSAPGYAPKTVSIVLSEPQGDGCCVCGGRVDQTVELTPMP
ncbi:carboxypeptidase-like regulatory domain-containing protein [Polyangium sp. y55x31]|uniref:carboxypeptidase-like regulatory domain-containing protein n=1 Tax=Polyangium sp. y55x31 TaxID=3042688 RepID=UPI0024825275|nr:carboxypeptidase-like regulatory domain-containing protein [Polyangium sp. y55x31]MDI1482064.1 carboxypeptidase-like regulatory domain-containing protein [Polyangium sp. y55x31]